MDINLTTEELRRLVSPAAGGADPEGCALLWRAAFAPTESALGHLVKKNAGRYAIFTTGPDQYKRFNVYGLPIR